MAHPATVESKKLSRANELIDAFIESNDQKEQARLSLLETVSCHYSGLSISAYRTATGYDDDIVVDGSCVDGLVAAIDACGKHN